MESLASRLVKLYLRLIRYNAPYQTKNIDPKKIRKDDIAKPDKFMCRGCDVTFDKIEEFKIWHITPKRAINDKIIFYMHGGAYIGGMVRQQWNTIAKIGRFAGSKIVIPDYPLAPEYNYKDALEMVSGSYTKLLETVPAKNVLFIGDSAGGGLMFSQAMLLRDQGKSLPGKLIALSPWVDLTMTNSRAVEVAPQDPMTAVPGLKRAGELYAGDADPSNYLISPLYGKMKGLPPIHIFAGTHDVLYPDEELFYLKAKKAGVETHYYEYPNMIHGWMFLPIPEAKRAIKQVVEICSDYSSM